MVCSQPITKNRIGLSHVCPLRLLEHETLVLIGGYDTDRLLMPAFGPSAIRDMFDGMADIASQLLLKWERYALHLLLPALFC